MTTEGRPAGTYACKYGVTDALAPFPLHSLVHVMSATINSNTVSFNVQETLPLLLRMVEPEVFSRYDSMTPTDLDYLADDNDAVQYMDWQLYMSMTTTYPKTNCICTWKRGYGASTYRNDRW
ncbi:MAG: phage major capsid domain-containing protein, partial [Candidatus Fonsibacter sp.]